MKRWHWSLAWFVLRGQFVAATRDFDPSGDDSLVISFRDRKAFEAAMKVVR